MLPFLKTNIRKEEKRITAFGGINITESAKNGELAFSENMTSDNFPSLSSAGGKRCVYETDRIINGISSFGDWICTSCSKDKSGIWLTFEGNDYEFTSYSSSNDFSATRKMAALSDSILIIPDNVVFFTNSRTFSRVCVLQKADSTSAKNKFHSEAPGSNLFDNYTIDYVAYMDHNYIKCRSVDYSYSGSHVFYYSSFDTSLKAGDIVTVKGSVYSPRDGDYPEFKTYAKKIAAGLTLKIKSVTTVTHSTPAGSITELTELIFEDNSIDTGGYRNINFENITLERGMPNLQNVCSHNNRIWATSGKEIFASKLSDASEWNDYTTDDYGTLPYASFNTLTETEGNFTAIIPFENHVYAFKENSIHKIYGNEPDEYTIYSDRVTGVAQCPYQTVSSCSDSLIYAGADAVYIYRDNYPKKISSPIGDYSSPLSSASSNNKFCLLCEENGKKIILVYDCEKDIWHRQTAENDSRFLTACSNRIFEAGGGKIFVIEDKNSDNAVSWKFKIRLDDKVFGRKTHGQISIKFSLGENSNLKIRPLYDDGTKGEICAFYHDEATGAERHAFLNLKRCSWMILEFYGKGEFTLRSMKIKFYRGSEI